MKSDSSISSTSVTKAKAAGRSLVAKKKSQEENVYEVNKSDSPPKDIALEVPTSRKTKTYRNISKQKGFEDTLQKKSIEQSKNSKKVENLNDTNDHLITMDNPNDDVLVPKLSQVKKHRNSPRQKGCDDAQKVAPSSTTKPANGTIANVDCTAETQSSTSPDGGSLPTLAQVKETCRRGRPSKSDAESNRTSRKTSTRVKPPCFEDESKQTPSVGSRGRPSRSTRTLR